MKGVSVLFYSDVMFDHPMPDFNNLAIRVSQTIDKWAKDNDCGACCFDSSIEPIEDNREPSEIA